MTIIAYQNGEMASDSLIDFSGTRQYGRKLFRLPDGSIFGGSGDAAQCARVVAWLREGKKGSAPRWSKVNGLHLMADGSLYVYPSSGVPIELDPKQPAAIGSGMDAALAILRTGGSLSAAVKAAVLVDSACGGDVDLMKAGA